MMKQYLMLGIAAVAMGAVFTSCNKNDFEPASQSDIIEAKYNQAFINTFGQPASNQNWGFGSTRGVTRGNAGVDYPSTEAYHNMNHNEWADPDKYFGGWLVPDPLTSGQIERVRKYFQANPNLEYKDPELRHFFIQQVYKGNTAQAGNSSETITAASGDVYSSGNMNLLSVGEANIHINDFNGGDCGESDVLNNGQKVGGTSHKDKITLMVNVDDTSCFGYHETGSSTQHNNKAALVSAADIDAWAAANGNPGQAVSDKWNRSFLGFDLAIKEGAQAYATDEAGNVLYATYDQAAESPKQAWDGEKIIDIADPTKSWPIEYYDEYKTIMNVGWLTTNKNFYVAADEVTMPQSISMNRAQASTITTIQNAPVLKDVMVGDTYYQSVVNLPRIKQLVNEGYLPVNNKSLTEWVKVGTSDGYFTDWIVTLAPAQRNENYTGRIFAEDLNAKEGSDFDFNDVVFDWKITDNGAKAQILLLAAGGTKELRIGGTKDDENSGVEVHNKFGVNTNIMVNTATDGASKIVTRGYQKFEITAADAGKQTFAADGSDIPIYVKKDGVWTELHAYVGQPAAKFNCPVGTKWVDEYVGISNAYPKFATWVGDPTIVWYDEVVEKYVNLLLKDNKE
jgi:hypothetical protein